VLDVLVSEIRLQAPGVVNDVGQRAARVGSGSNNGAESFGRLEGPIKRRRPIRGRRNTRGRSEVREALTEGQPCHPIVAAMLDDMRR
jgi:hypothetical protein